jgi:hypothetical protein
VAAAQTARRGRAGTFGSGGNAGDGNVRRAAAGLKRACPPKLQRRQGPADRRHSGAPKGERAFRCPSATYAPRLTRAATLAPKGATTTTRCACRRSARPSIGWVKRKLTRAHPRAGTRRPGLFDIVRWDDTATVRRRAASSAALIPSSPRGARVRERSTKWNVRARVSKGEDEQRRSPSCLETHRGAVQLWNDLRSCRATMLLGMRARPRAEHQPAAVRNHRRRGFIVSGLLFTMNFATAACRPRRAFISLHAAPDRAATRPRAVELPPSCAPARCDPCRECGIRSPQRR